MARIKSEVLIEADLRGQRKKAGLSVRQMANKLKIDRGTYSQMERGIRAMPVDKYYKFREVINN